MAELNFDATKVAPDTGYDVVPNGWYNVMIDESEIKPTKDGTGAYLNLRFEVADGQYKGRKIFSKFNIKNNNPQAQEIAFKQLSAVAHAVGVLQVQNSEMLHNRPLKVKVKIKKDATGTYEDQNEITSYKNINEQVDMAGATPAPTPNMFAVPAAKPATPLPVAPVTTLPPPAAPAPVAAPEYVMAPGETFTREQYKGTGWTDEQLVAAGKMMIKSPVAPPPVAAAPAQPWGPPAPAATAPAPAAPTPQAPPAAPAAPAGAPATPPWARPPAA